MHQHLSRCAPRGAGHPIKLWRGRSYSIKEVLSERCLQLLVGKPNKFIGSEGLSVSGPKFNVHIIALGVIRSTLEIPELFELREIAVVQLIWRNL
jgi:hypothetical protein